MTDRYEVIIVGGGMVGATAACALGHGGIRVALLDAYNPERQWPPESVDIRVSALTKASQNILELLGAWQGMVQRGVCAYRDMRVFDARGGGELHFDCADTAFNELGHLVENRVIVAALWDVLATLPSATCLTPAFVSGLQLTEKGRQVKLSDGRILEAELVIAADGSESALRTMMGIKVTGWDYHQAGLVATVTTEKSHQATAWQCFLDEGPLAFLPLKNGQCSIVWTLKSATAKNYLALNDKDFLQVLEQASGGILGKLLTVGPRAAFPLRFQYADRYIDERFALIGDAAHVMHPLAGQGANAGFLDAAAIAELVIKTKQERRPLSSSRFLRNYERWRKGDNLVMMASMDVINKIYQMTSPPFVSMRSAGMNRINDTALLKTYLNHYAMGLREDLPKLAKGQACW
ncbi:MAG: UbiH/UbiF/VisC/COQ6 family ubiquinone biosynthesis hydroxylase [Methylobacter sp.]|nr:UbiH/UbiF/VisC/COQ6 family ubiquinone biosynthesis hydroxylase [Methylobacter sp.]